MLNEDQRGVAMLKLATFRMSKLIQLMDSIKDSTFYFDKDWVELDDSETLVHISLKHYNELIRRYTEEFKYTPEQVLSYTEEYISTLQRHEFEKDSSPKL